MFVFSFRVKPIFQLKNLKSYKKTRFMTFENPIFSPTQKIILKDFFINQTFF